MLANLLSEGLANLSNGYVTRLATELQLSRIRLLIYLHIGYKLFRKAWPTFFALMHLGIFFTLYTFMLSC
jgi:hypothetical protein